MIDFLLNAVVTLFVTVDPIGLVPAFIALTAGLSSAERRAIGLRATTTATAVLIAFALFGQNLLAFLGISLAAFRIAGGLLLFWIAFEMVFDLRLQRKARTVENVPPHPDDISHVAVVPLAIPLIAGPGSISATILLATHAPGYLELAGLIAVIVGLMAANFAVILLAGTIDRLLGKTGRLVLSRLLGVILAALSVQFIADGVGAFAAGTTF
jgi:multiple antibiotic resistance protein